MESENRDLIKFLIIEHFSLYEHERAASAALYEGKESRRIQVSQFFSVAFFSRIVN
jgi:hypothetical protein